MNAEEILDHISANEERTVAWEVALEPGECVLETSVVREMLAAWQIVRALAAQDDRFPPSVDEWQGIVDEARALVARDAHGED